LGLTDFFVESDVLVINKECWETGKGILGMDAIRDFQWGI